MQVMVTTAAVCSVSRWHIPTPGVSRAMNTMLTMEHIRKPLAARQVLSRSETVLQKSLEITEEADLALRNAMARIK